MRVEFIVIFIALFLFVPKAFAADITHTISQKDHNVSDEIEADVTFSINSSDGTEYYLRGVFYRPGDNNYCGYTWNGTDWFKGPYSSNDQWKNFLKIIVSNNSWTGKLKAKIDPEDSGCTQSGEYLFKIQRFTTSGGSSFDSQEETSLNFVIPTSTPTPSPTSSPTNTPKPTKTPTPTLKPKNTEPISIKTTMTDDENARLTKDILEGQDVYSNSHKSLPRPSPTSKKKANVLGIDNLADADSSTSSRTKSLNKKGNIFIYLGGTSMLTSCGILLFQTYRKRDET